jgi:hypothetical protein
MYFIIYKDGTVFISDSVTDNLLDSVGENVSCIIDYGVPEAPCYWKPEKDEWEDIKGFL